MTTIISQHVRYLDRHPEIFKKFILCKPAASFTAISRK